MYNYIKSFRQRETKGGRASFSFLVLACAKLSPFNKKGLSDSKSIWQLPLARLCGNIVVSSMIQKISFLLCFQVNPQMFR
jgi:hypothetical protein